MKMKVPFFDYPQLYSLNKNKFIEIFDDVSSRGAFIMQNDLKEFENRIAKYCNVKYAIGVANATDALEISFKLLGLKKGDEVVFPSHTMLASPSSVIINSGVPVPCECNEEGLIDIESLRNSITKKTKFIMPVQLNGRTCKMDPILEIAKQYELKIVEDSAQGLGSRYKGKMAGTFGDAGVYSFYPAKILGTLGDGGMIITDNENFYHEALSFRDHGRKTNSEETIWGRNSRLHNLHAAFLNFQFDYFEKTIEKRRKIAYTYKKWLSNIEEIKLPVYDDDDHYDTYQNFEILCDSRDQLKKHLANKNIGTLIQWGGKAVHQFKNLGFSKYNLPNTDKYFERCLLIPMNVFLSDNQVEHVCKSIIEFYK